MVVVSSFLGWISGYLVDPAFFGFFTPFILIPIFILPIVVLVWMLIDLRRSEKRNSKNYWACFTAGVAVIFLLSPLRPNSVDGFYYRMEKLDRDVYLSAAELVKIEAERSGVSSLDLGYPTTETHAKFVESLRGKNILFSMSSWPIHVSNNKDYVLLSWGSGLTGAYEVLITSGEEDPRWLVNTPYPPKKLYKNVILLID